MPYLTPDSVPEGGDCRPLLIPAATEWLAIVSGALTELIKPWNWEQFGSVTVEEAITVMQTMIDNYYAADCGGCTTPGGYRIIRINTTTGRVEQLEGEEWVDATDEYEIPPPAAREEGSSDDQICLAATNAVNVLETLYNSLSDSFGSELSEAAALVAFVEGAVLAVGFAFAPITFGIAAFSFAFFEILYQALAYLTADLWTDDFSHQIVCFLVNCASNDAGVVTFDWQCFNDQLNSLADSFSLSEIQIRLYLQVAFMLQFIGGADGLNLAGGTTEISVGDCPCFAHCHFFDFTITDGDFIPGYPDFAPPAAYISDWITGEGWVPSGSPAIYNGFYIDFDPVDISQLTVHWVGGDEGMGSCGNISIELYLGGVQQAVVSTDQSWQATGTLQILGAYTGDRIIVSGNNCPNTGWAFDWLEVSYSGEQVFGEDNCP